MCHVVSSQSTQLTLLSSSSLSSHQKCIFPINEVQPEDWKTAVFAITVFFNFSSKRQDCSWIEKVSFLPKNHRTLLSHSKAAAGSLASRFLGVPLDLLLPFSDTLFCQCRLKPPPKTFRVTGLSGYGISYICCINLLKKYLKVPQLLTFPKVICDGKCNICVKC